MKLSPEEQIRMLRSVVEVREGSKLIKTCVLDNNAKIKEGKVKYELGSPESVDDIASDVIDKLCDMETEPKGMAMSGMIKVLVAYMLKSDSKEADDE